MAGPVMPAGSTLPVSWGAPAAASISSHLKRQGSLKECGNMAGGKRLAAGQWRDASGSGSKSGRRAGTRWQ